MIYNLCGVTLVLLVEVPTPRWLRPVFLPRGGPGGGAGVGFGVGGGNCLGGSCGGGVGGGCGDGRWWWWWGKHIRSRFVKHMMGGFI